jgi:hypothetical protein
MTAVEFSRPLQTIFPSSTTTKPQTPSRRTAGYKKIRWRKYDPSKKTLNSTPDLFVQWQPPDSAKDADEDGDVVHPTPKKTEATRREAAKETTRTKSLGSRLSPVEPLPSNGTRVNPFLTLPIKQTGTVQDTMDYFVTICKGTNPDNSMFSGPVNPHLSLLLPYALRHAMLFESIVSVCRASILISLGRPIWEDYAFVQHRGSTITRLNEKLKTKEATDTAALLTVTMLMTLEYLCGDQQGVLMHCRGLERMLELRGPLRDEDDPEADSEWLKFVKLGLTAYKALGSFVTGQPPKAPPDSVAYLSETFEELQLDQPLSYPDKPFSSDMCIVLSRLPSGLSELCLTAEISVQMIKLLASISAATALLTHEPVKYNNLPVDTWTPRSSTPSSPSSDEIPQAYDLDAERKHMMIQTILSSLQRMSLTTTRPLEYHLTSGLLAFLFQLRDLGPVNLFYDPILRKFITTLPNHARPSTRQEQNCLIWASMAVAGTLALRVVPMPDSHLVMDHALDLYREMRSWPSLEKILRSCLVTEEILAHWRRVWQTAMNRREFLLRQRNTVQVAYTDFSSDPVADPSAELEPEINNESDIVPRIQSADQIISQMAESTALGMDSNTIKAHMMQHITGAPRSMMELTQSMGLCPLRSQIAAQASAAKAGKACTISTTSPTPTMNSASTSAPASSLCTATGAMTPESI